MALVTDDPYPALFPSPPNPAPSHLLSSPSSGLALTLPQLRAAGCNPQTSIVATQEGRVARGDTQLPGDQQGKDLTGHGLQVDCHLWLPPEFWTYLANFLPALKEPWSLPAPLPSLGAERSRPFSHIWAAPAHLQRLPPSPEPLLSLCSLYLALLIGAQGSRGVEREGAASRPHSPYPGALACFFMRSPSIHSCRGHKDSACVRPVWRGPWMNVQLLPVCGPAPPPLPVLSASGSTSNAKSSLLYWTTLRPGNEALLQKPLGAVPSLPQVLRLAQGPRLREIGSGTGEADRSLALVSDFFWAM